MKIAILGGGLTGLILGHFLHKKGIDFDILEKENECGGLMRTSTDNDFIFDYGGSHIVFTKDKEVLEFMLALLGDNKVQHKRNTKILYKQSYVKYPFENGLSDLSKEDNYECLHFFIQNLIDKSNKKFDTPLNLKSWCYYTFGRGIADKYLIPYNEKIWKFPLENMGLDWVERIPNPPVEDIIKSSLGITTEGYTHQLYYYYPKVGGIQSIIENLEKEIKLHITTKFNVKRIMKQGDKWTISDDKNSARVYNKIISTIPLPDLIQALCAPEEILKAANNLKYNSLITVLIGIKEKNISQYSWLYIPDPAIITHRICFPSNYSPYAAPANSSSVLSEITTHIDSEIWNKSDEEILYNIVNQLDSLGIIDKSKVCHTNVKRTKYAYVINDLDYNNNLVIIKNYLKENNIDSIGRFGEFKYLNMDGCIRSVIDYINILDL